MRVAIVGAGLVGRRTARHLADAGEQPVVIPLRRARPHLAGVETLDAGTDPGPVDAVVLAAASSEQPRLAHRWLKRDVPIVSTADSPRAVRALVHLDQRARRSGVPIVAGAACSPGLSTLLVSVLATRFDKITTITTARFGTGGPACAREHHRSMAAAAYEVREGVGRWARGGSGRTLVWFPDPIGGQDCYRGGLADVVLLQRCFPHVDRIQTVQAATRRDRLTARLPMLRPPHAEGLVGACWAEVRGTIAGVVEHQVLAATAPQASAAAAIAALTVREASRLSPGVHSVAELPNTPNLVRLLPNTVRLWAHDGSQVRDPGPGAPIQAARKWPKSRR